jgi:regulator of sigma D
MKLVDWHLHNQIETLITITLNVGVAAHKQEYSTLNSSNLNQFGS